MLSLVNNTQISIDELRIIGVCGKWLAVAVCRYPKLLAVIASQKWLPRQLFVVIFVGGFFQQHTKFCHVPITTSTRL
ncbi:MAG: hypothetical protein U5L01_03140 [Rheinheimera sp.]|nr:hypothetical protein [Rheinheimera sp.]